LDETPTGIFYEIEGESSEQIEAAAVPLGFTVNDFINQGYGSLWQKRLTDYGIFQLTGQPDIDMVFGHLAAIYCPA